MQRVGHRLTVFQIALEAAQATGLLELPGADPDQGLESALQMRGAQVGPCGQRRQRQAVIGVGRDVGAQIKQAGIGVSTHGRHCAASLAPRRSDTCALDARRWPPGRSRHCPEYFLVPLMHANER